MPAVQRIELYTRQRQIPVDLPRLRVFAEIACQACLHFPGPDLTRLSDLAGVEISIVSDRAISKVHRQFLNVRGPTDVITFPHGEILVSAVTAARQAHAENEPVDREVARYIVHGLLHLNGHLDKDPPDAAAMWAAQEEILSSAWAKDSR